MEYDHTQKGPLYLILIPLGVFFLGTARLMPHPAATWSFIIAGIAMWVFALGFRQLTVRDAGDHLLVQLGPLPLFRRQLPYGEIESVKGGHGHPMEGFGIHLSVGGGWTWNLWGKEVVDVTLTGNRRIRIGTDDPEGLQRFIQSRL